MLAKTKIKESQGLTAKAKNQHHYGHQSVFESTVNIAPYIILHT